MASVRTFTLPHYGAFPVHVALFKNVKNASFLRRQLLEANPEYDYAFLDASMVGHGSLPVHCFFLATSDPPQSQGPLSHLHQKNAQLEIKFRGETITKGATLSRRVLSL
jgi:hypothetical protein